ncbi:hypothetical protein D3C73_730830 [compost metagenome]
MGIQQKGPSSGVPQIAGGWISGASRIRAAGLPAAHPGCIHAAGPPSRRVAKNLARDGTDLGFHGLRPAGVNEVTHEYILEHTNQEQQAGENQQGNDQQLLAQGTRGRQSAEKSCYAGNHTRSTRYPAPRSVRMIRWSLSPSFSRRERMYTSTIFSSPPKS